MRFTREQLEQKIMLECLMKIDDQGLKALKCIIEKQCQAAFEQNKRDFFFFDNVFHKTCFEIAGREEIWRWMNKSNTHLERFRWLRIVTKELDWAKITNQHKKILDTIFTKDVDEMNFLIMSHLHMMLDEKILLSQNIQIIFCQKMMQIHKIFQNLILMDFNLIF